MLHVIISTATGFMQMIVTTNYGYFEKKNSKNFDDVIN